MVANGEQVITIELTREEAENIKREMITVLSNYKAAALLTSLNTLNNIISVELTRLAND